MHSARLFSVRKFSECNEDTAFKMSFTDIGLDNMARRYRQVRGLPDFVDAILHFNPQSENVQMLKNQPGIIGWSDDGDAVILPNTPWIDKDTLVKNPKAMKDGEDGCELVAWYVHPAQLQETVFAEKKNRANFLVAANSVSSLVHHMIKYDWLIACMNERNQYGVPINLTT